MAAAVALRSAARKVCGRAFERPQAYFTTAASAALKEEQRRLLPRISRGGSSLRRFSSSESQNGVNNSKQGAKPFATKPGEVLPHDSPLLFKDIHPDTLVRIPISTSPWSADNPKFLSNVKKLVLGTVIAGSAVVYLEAMYIFRYDVSETK